MNIIFFKFDNFERKKNCIIVIVTFISLNRIS